LENLKGPVVLVDNTSSQTLAEAYPRFIERGVHIVTPNKKAFSSCFSLFKEILDASSRHAAGTVLHEATVGAGLPVLSTLNDLLETGDEIQKIEGVFSGTMSYLFNSFAPTNPPPSPRAFSDCVKEARALGYTEPDPRDDLNGMDVARKLTILARLCGLEVSEPTAFPTQSLIPQALEGAASAEEFLEGLPAFDGVMEGTRDEAERNGRVVRYVGSLDLIKKELSVGSKAFDKDSVIAGLKGSDNIFSFYTKRYGERPLVIQGAG
jgi:homoserine dehydrogenase